MVPAERILGHVVDVRAGLNDTSGGSSDRELEGLTGEPGGSAIVDGCDDGDPGAEVAEHLAHVAGGYVWCTYHRTRLVKSTSCAS